MPQFDPDTGQLFLQIVYDGAAYAGKTASVESLGRQFGREVVTPQAQNGRTLLFDWLEYEGGVRFGRPITCRVLTVPGQPEYRHRRTRLLRDADGIIFVADSREEAFASTLEQWHSLHEIVQTWSLDASITVQLNHRDDEAALPAATMREALREIWPAERIFESTAVQDRGSREVFVLTVGDTMRRHLAHGDGTLSSRKPSMRDTRPVRVPTADELAMLLTET